MSTRRPRYPQPCWAPALLLATGQVLARLDPGLVLPALVFGLGAALVVAIGPRRGLVLALALGAGLVQGRTTTLDGRETPGVSGLARVTGRIADRRPTGSGGERLTLEVERPASARGALLRLELAERASPALRPGDRVSALGMLSPLSAPGNPGEADWSGRDRRRGVIGRLRVSSPDALTFQESDPAPRHRLAGLRQAIGTALERRLSGESAGLARALLLGERQRLPGDLRRAIEGAGAAHFLAVSGLHVGLLLAIARWLIGPHRSTAARVALALMLILYASLAGGSAATVRAAAVAVAWLVAEARRRPCNGRNLLGGVVLATLLVHPSWIEDPGLQLSVSAVLAILIFSEHWPRATRARPRRRWMQALQISTAAWLGTIPASAWHFGTIHPYSALVSVLLLPVFVSALLLSLGALVAMAMPVLLPVVDLSLELTVAVLRATAGLVSSLPGATVPISPPAAGVLCLLSVSVIAAGRGTRGRTLAVLLVLSSIAWTLQGRGARLTAPRLLAFDVGHGSALLVQSAEGRGLLVDAGSAHRSSIGEQLLLPQLDRLGIDRLEALILTHPDHDHVGGTRELVRSGRVDRILVSSYFGLEPVGAKLLAWLRDRRVPVTIVGTGDRFELGEARLTVHHPPKHRGSRERRPLSRNDASLAFTLEVSGERALLTGDLEEAGLAMLTARPRPDRHSALLLPHHGNEVGGLEALCHWAGAPLLLASRSDRFDLGPTKSTAERLGLALYTTDRHGALTVHLADHPRVYGHRR